MSHGSLPDLGGVATSAASNTTSLFVYDTRAGIILGGRVLFFCSPSRVSPRSYFSPLFPLLDVQEVSKHCFLFHTDSWGLAVLVIFPGEVQRFIVRREDVILRRLEKKILQEYLLLAAWNQSTCPSLFGSHLAS